MKKVFCVAIEDEMRIQLSDLAMSDGRSMGDVVRRAISFYINHCNDSIICTGPHGTTSSEPEDR